MDYQKTFFDFLKANIPKDTTLPDYIEDKLHVSRDGAYRRIGGRTALTLNEAMALLQSQGLNMGDFTGTTPGKMIFDQISTGIDGSHSVFSSYLDFLSKISPLELTYLANSIPRNHLFGFPDLTFFQMFFTAKTMFGDPNFQHINFATGLPQKAAFLELLEPVSEFLNQIPSTEILWFDAVDSLLNPMLYYRETHQFDDEETIFYLLDQLTEFIGHLEKMAAAGRKIEYGKNRDSLGAPFQLYFTEVPLHETTAIFRLDQGPIVLHVMNGLNMISTANTHYCQRVQSLAQSIMEKSSNLVSGGEKLRIQFFNAQYRKIETTRKQIKLMRIRG